MRVEISLLASLISLTSLSLQAVPYLTHPDPDDLLDQGYSAQNGSFFLEGKTEEGTPIDPTLKIYHNCNDELEPGYRKVVFTLPDKSITRAAKPNSTFDAGVIQLELEFKDEEREFTID